MYIPEAPDSKPVITVCGGPRYKDEEIELTKKLTAAGWTVLHIERPYYKSLKAGVGFNYGNILELNRSRIRASEMLYVIKRDGDELGGMTKLSIKYAEAMHKPIYYMDVESKEV